MSSYNYVDDNFLDSSSESFVDVLYNLRYDGCNAIERFTKWYASQSREVSSYVFFLLRLLEYCLPIERVNTTSKLKETTRVIKKKQ